jgi:dolichol-phosphate mannosyltransferase
MLIIALPIFNEADGISDFMFELKKELDDFSPLFVAVEDRSTDNTYEILRRMESEGFPVTVVQNDVNRGHGYSVISGAKIAIDMGPSAIVLCDGDGQFLAADIRALVEIHMRDSNLIVEGVRVGRVDPWFRRLISIMCRFLVYLSCRRIPKDANTPLRVISPQAAKSLLDEVEDNCLIPNLAMCVLSRTLGFEIVEINVSSIPPRRKPGSIDQWKQRSSFLPSKRLLRFVLLATISWKDVAIKSFALQKSRSTFNLRDDGKN